MSSPSHLDKPRASRGAQRRAKLSLSALFFALFLCVAKAAAGVPAITQTVANAASGTANSFSLSFPNNTVAGDVILVGFSFTTSATPSSISDSQGNTFTEVGNQLTSPGGGASRVYYAKNIKGGADTVTVKLSANSTYLEVYLTEYSGVDQTNPIDAQAGASGNAGSVSSGNATTNFVGDMIYGYCAADWSCTAGSGFTALSTFNSNLIEDKTAGNPGAYAATGTATNGWTMQMVALKPASSQGTPLQTVANAASGTTNFFFLSFPNNTVAGDIILVGFDFIASATLSSISDSQGNAFTEVGNQLTSPGGGASRVYYAKNIKGGADTVTVKLSANSAYIEVYLTEYSGVDQTNPIDAQAGASGNAGSVSSGNATTSFVGDVIYGYCAADWRCTAGSGFTALSTLNSNLTENMVAGGPGAYAATGTATNGWTMQMVALKPASSGGAVPPVTTAAAASLSAASLTFVTGGVGIASAAQTITLTNAGGAALNITSIAITGANATDFTEVNTCSLPLLAGGNCTIVILFTPSATGARTASLTIADNASSSPQSVALSGTGSHDVVLSWTPSPTPGIAGYDVYRGTASGQESSTPLNPSPINGSTYTDVNVTAGATYYYVVTAVSGAAQSAKSNETSATVP